MSTTSIRAAVVDDAAALADLHLDVWDDGYTGLVPQSVLDARRATPKAERVTMWEKRLTGSATTWVAEDEDGLVGFASAGKGRDGSGMWELMALYVRARVYGTGVGHALFRATIGDRPAFLWVLVGNERATRFYERQGFRADGQEQSCDEGLERRMVRS
ncbi:GNAT family N-acetyltransferase [Nocardioides sp. JQ2195]|uniref:GNAT family N-acetyltransferase n=1 Tax=Nocardioides sp. JQ2195 TaxID=2592334 RepID=UPI00143E4FBF|nr:GNAT family N-acetyltransferase [Nocardioides sp. JQ2195]QIX26669.1 GNAT family N-acetyltransferase [Nocardioides sp. JQ2195]